MPGLRVCVDVEDLEAGVAFYARALGLRAGRRFGADWVELLGGPCPIDLVAKAPGTAAFADGGRAAHSYERHWTPVHLDFVVDDLGAALRAAVAAGATLERDAEAKAWGRIAVLADPFGHGFCLLEFTGRGYDEVVAP